MVEAQKVKEDRRRKHSRAGKEKPKAERKSESVFMFLSMLKDTLQVRSPEWWSREIGLGIRDCIFGMSLTSIRDRHCRAKVEVMREIIWITLDVMALLGDSCICTLTTLYAQCIFYFPRHSSAILPTVTTYAIESVDRYRTQTDLAPESHRASLA